VNPNTREQLTQQPHTEITTKLQQTVESQLRDNHPIIHRIEKLKSQDICIHCKTEEEAEQLRSVKWDNAYNGLTVRKAKFGIVIPEVPISMINPKNLQDSELLRELEQQNEGL
jgi:hypothetical protein